MSSIMKISKKMNKRSFLKNSAILTIGGTLATSFPIGFKVAGSTGGMSKMEDERDACFVLVSRGQEEVHLFGTETYRKAEMGPSRFIFEMGDCIEMG